MSDLRPPQPPTGSFIGVGSSSLRSIPTLAHSSEMINTETENVMKKVEKTKRATRPQPKVDLQNLPDLLTIGEVSSLLRVSPLTIKRWGKRGKLPAIRINSRGDRRYKKQAVLWMLGMTE
ncbi:MAG: MerR family transcriptional regulator [Patescibacteria group bacterium]